MDKLIQISNLLVEKETLDGEEMEALFDTPRPQPKLVTIPGKSGGVQRIKPEEEDKLKGMPDLSSGGLAPA